MAREPTVSFPPEYANAYCGRQVYIACHTFLVMCTLLLALRVWARHLTTSRVGWDDGLIAMSYLFLLGLIILFYVMTPKAGVGRHMSVLMVQDPKKLETWEFFIFLLEWFYVPSSMLSRISICSLYLRIFVKPWARRFCWIMIALLVSYAIAYIVSALLQCVPLQYLWDKSIPGGHCFDIVLWFKVYNPPNIVVDIALLLLPAPTIWALKASFPRRVGIGIVCLTGSLGLVASCARCAFFFQLLDSPETDTTWTSPPLLVWTLAESGMYFCAANLVCLRPLYAKLPPFIRDHWTITLGKSTRTASNTRSGAKVSRFWPTNRIDHPDCDSWTKINQGLDPWSDRAVGTYDVEASHRPLAETSTASTKGDLDSVNLGLGGINVSRTVDVTSISGLCDAEERRARSSHH